MRVSEPRQRFGHPLTGGGPVRALLLHANCEKLPFVQERRWFAASDRPRPVHRKHCARAQIGSVGGDKPGVPSDKKGNKERKCVRLAPVSVMLRRRAAHTLPHHPRQSQYYACMKCIRRIAGGGQEAQCVLGGGVSDVLGISAETKASLRSVRSHAAAHTLLLAAFMMPPRNTGTGTTHAPQACSSRGSAHQASAE